MSFLSRVILPQDPARTERIARYQREAAEAEEQARLANSFSTRALQTLSGSAGIVRDAGVSLARGVLGDLFITPADRASEAIGRTGIFGSNVRRGYEDFSQTGESRTFASIPVRPQRSFDDGGLTQIGGTALKSAGYLAPAGALNRAASSLIRGNVGSAAVAGGTYGAITGAATGAGEAMERGDTTRQVVRDAAIGAGMGGVLGFGLAGAGGFLSRTRKSQTQAPNVPRLDSEFEGMTLQERLNATSERRLQVQDEDRLPRRIRVSGESETVAVTPSNRYFPDQELPVIQVLGNTRNRSNLPTIQTKARTNASRNDLTYEPVPVRISSESSGTSRRTNRPTVDETFTEEISLDPVRRNTVQSYKQETLAPLSAVKSDGVTRRRGLSSGVEQKAIEQKLTTGFIDVPEYRSVNMKEQAAKASKLINENYEQARKIALGRINPPDDILPESVFVAVENHALKSGDVATLRDLATRSRLTAEATIMGQRIAALASRNPDSAASQIAKVAQARRQAAARRNGDIDSLMSAEKARIKKTINSAPKSDWVSFVDSITC